MRRRWSKATILYLRGSHLVGARRHKGRIQKLMDCPVEKPGLLVPMKGPVILLLHRDSMAHRVVSAPAKGKIPLGRLMAHEAVELSELPAGDVAFGWRSMGPAEEGGVAQERYLLGVCPRKEIQEMARLIEGCQLEVADVVSALDLMVECGRRTMGQEPGLLVVFDHELVHTLFFKDATYGFHRVFRLGQEAFGEELLLEFQRSAYYAKQRHKAEVAEIRVALPPPWFHEEMASSLRAVLQVPCKVIPPPPGLALFPELGLLHLLLQDPSLGEPLFSVIPSEVHRHRYLKRIAAMSTAVELLLLGLVALSIWILRTSGQQDRELLHGYRRSLQVLEDTIQLHQKDIQQMERLRQSISLAQEILAQKPSLHLHLESLSYLVPEGIHLESVRWFSPSEAQPKAQGRVRQEPRGPKAEEPGFLYLSGKVDLGTPEGRYDLFGQWLELLKEEFPHAQFQPRTDELLPRGTFELALPVTGGRG